jgi:hypothetical protein
MRTFSVIGLFIISCVLFSQDWGLSETARSAGMGNAYTAMSDGADVMVFNPAGILNSPRYQALLTYSKDYAGLDFGSISQGSLILIPRSEKRLSWGFGANIYNEDVYQMLSASLGFGGRVSYIANKRGYISVFGIGNLYRVNYNSSNFFYIPEDGDNPDDPLFRDGYDKIAIGADIAFLFP